MTPSGPVKLSVRSVALLAAGLLGLAVVVAPAAVASNAPTITVPSDGTSFCSASSQQITISGTADPGTTVTLYDGSSSLGQLGVDGDGNWSDQVRYLATGQHTLTATDDDGSTGTSPASTPVQITIIRRQAAQLTLSPTRINPKTSGYYARATLGVSAPTAGHAVLAIKRGVATIRESSTLNLRAGESTSWVWDGEDSGGSLVGSGVYRAVLTWSQTGCSSTVLSKSLTVDETAPRAAAYRRSLSTFYPRRDDAFGGYKNDEALVATRMSERSTARIEIFRAGVRRPIVDRRLGEVGAGGSARYDWDGRNGAGVLEPAGRYQFRFILADAVGNTRVGPLRSFSLSLMHVVRKTIVVSKPGADYTGKYAGTACGVDFSRTLSSFTHGLWINYCGFDDNDVAIVAYRFAAPAARIYHSIRPFVYGDSVVFGNTLPVLSRDYAIDKYEGERGATPSEGLHRLTVRYGPDFVSASGRSELVAGFAGSGNYDYDIAYIGIEYVVGDLEP